MTALKRFAAVALAVLFAAGIAVMPVSARADSWRGDRYDHGRYWNRDDDDGGWFSFPGIVIPFGGFGDRNDYWHGDRDFGRDWHRDGGDRDWGGWGRR